MVRSSRCSFAGFPMELPSISVVESDGQWYVSPIGTVGASVVELFRSVPDDANLIDTPLARCLASAGWTARRWTRCSRPASTIPPECDPVADGRRRRSPDGDPRSTGERDPCLRECPVHVGVPERQRQRQLHARANGRGRGSRPRLRRRSCPASTRAAGRGLGAGGRPRRPTSGAPIRSVRFRAHDVGAVDSFCPDRLWARRVCGGCRLRSVDQWVQ